MQQDKFYVSHNGQELGPFSLTEISHKVEDGELLPVDYLYVEEAQDWLLIDEFLKANLPGHVADEGETAVGFEMREETVLDTNIALELNDDLPEAVPTLPKVEKIEPEVPPIPEKEDSSSKVVLRKAEEKKDNITDLVAKAKIENSKEAANSAPSSTSSLNLADLAKAGGGTVKIVNGVGFIEIAHTKAGKVKLALRDDSKKGIDTSKMAELAVKAGKAKKVVLSCKVKETVVGEPVHIELEAHDAYDNVDESFSGKINAKLNGSAKGSGEVKFQKGIAKLEISNQVAENIKVELSDAHKAGLDVSAKLEVKFKAGPATQFVIDSPNETVAGEAVKVQVKALDKFGNLATDFDSSVQLDILGSASTKAG